MLKEAWERFGFVLGDVASPKRPWVLHSLLFESLCGQMAEWLHVLLLVPQRLRVQIPLKTFGFVAILNLIWHFKGIAGGVQTKSCSSVEGFFQESWKSITPCGLHQDSKWSIPGVYLEYT